MKVVYLFPIFSTMVWGVSIVGAKILGNLGLLPLEVTYFRFLIASVVFVPLLIVRAGRGEKVVPRGREWFPIIGLALTGVAVNNTIFYLGLQRTDASIASMIVSINPLMTMLFAVLLLGEKMTSRKWTSVFLGVLGVLFLVGGDVTQGQFYGNLLVLTAVTIWGMSFSFSKKLSNHGFSSVVLTGWSEILGTLFLVPLTVGSYGKLYRSDTLFWGWLLFIGIVASVISYILHYRAVEVLGAGVVAPSTNIIPFSGMITSAILLHEKVNPLSLFGAVLVLIGVYIVQTENS